MTKRRMIGTTTVSTRITKPMYKALLDFLERNAHINVADYLRDLIRKDLEVPTTPVKGKGTSETPSEEAPK